MPKKQKNLEKNLVLLSRRILRLLKKEGSVKVILTSGTRMAYLKKKFLLEKKGLSRTLKNPVDVLSFREPKAFPHPEARELLLGEVYLNQEIGNRDPGRLRFLLLHGILHILGYDHESRRDIIKMEKMEETLWRAIS